MNTWILGYYSHSQSNIKIHESWYSFRLDKHIHREKGGTLGMGTLAV